MNLEVNGKTITRDVGMTIEDLLISLDLDPSSVAVAINHSVVPRSLIGSHSLVEADQVEIIRAVGGG
ncbi:MAG: sulfur carrier protein ThiS [Myxococcota bacterium]